MIVSTFTLEAIDKFRNIEQPKNLSTKTEENMQVVCTCRNLPSIAVLLTVLHGTGECCTS